MSMSDPIADMLTRIRNGQARGKVTISMPVSKQRMAIAELLRDEGYISDASIEAGDKPQLVLEAEVFSR
jgi:small subunit ribosomal protein S8